MIKNLPKADWQKISIENEQPVGIDLKGEDSAFVEITVVKNVQATVLLSWSSGVSQANHKIQVRLLEGAQLHWTQMQEGSVGNSAESSIQTVFDLDSMAHVKSLTVSLGGVQSVTEISSDLKHENSHVELNGIFVGQKDQRISQRTSIVHHVPRCSSRQVYKGILADQSRSQFVGDVHIQKGAFGTDSGQVHKALLLSRKAFAEAEPRLRIDADDVKASHGATVGQLQADEVYYLQSRALSKAQSEALLCEAFVQDLVLQIENSQVRKKVQQSVSEAVRSALAGMHG